MLVIHLLRFTVAPSKRDSNIPDIVRTTAPDYFLLPFSPFPPSFFFSVPRCSSGYYETRFQRRLRHYLYVPPEKNVGCMPVGLCHFRRGRSISLTAAFPRFSARRGVASLSLANGENPLLPSIHGMPPAMKTRAPLFLTRDIYIIYIYIGRSFVCLAPPSRVPSPRLARRSRNPVVSIPCCPDSRRTSHWVDFEAVYHYLILWSYRYFIPFKTLNGFEWKSVDPISYLGKLSHTYYSPKK